MGGNNYRFKLSDIIPKATWFYKLKQSPPFNTKQNSSPSNPRKSYYFTRDLNNPSSITTHLPTKSSPLCSETSMDVRQISSADNKFDESGQISHSQLPPIITRPNEKFKQRENRRSSDSKTDDDNDDGSGTVKATRKEKKSRAMRRYAGVKVRVHSPRIGSRNREIENDGGGGRRRRLLDSLAIVKSSYDPQKDFRESMMEMIVENNIRAPKELEDLLACYLALNSDQYHNLIIKVFKQIWFDLKQLGSSN
ncbi:transcription repressor OFP1-like [Carica papaya]|uniref:transcription repressor OFP1-like n=1 Tax=Carica papaya TaxID=3649 RepID=UPI000B8CCE62|nr:transcription repressor OFP1-like [Carica papaya]